MLVMNQPVMMCCGRPRAECSCPGGGHTVKSHNYTATPDSLGLPLYNFGDPVYNAPSADPPSGNKIPIGDVRETNGQNHAATMDDEGNGITRENEGQTHQILNFVVRSASAMCIHWLKIR